jgi:hypothetical protein
LSRAVAQTGKGKASVLRYVPQADLTVIDPVMTTAYITRYHATMVWDQLYGIDSKLQPQPQMVEGHTLEDDGRSGPSPCATTCVSPMANRCAAGTASPLSNDGPRATRWGRRCSPVWRK